MHAPRTVGKGSCLVNYIEMRFHRNCFHLNNTKIRGTDRTWKHQDCKYAGTKSPCVREIIIQKHTSYLVDVFEGVCVREREGL